MVFVQVLRCKTSKTSLFSSGSGRVNDGKVIGGHTMKSSLQNDDIDVGLTIHHSCRDWSDDNDVDRPCSVNVVMPFRNDVT